LKGGKIPQLGLFMPVFRHRQVISIFRPSLFLFLSLPLGSYQVSVGEDSWLIVAHISGRVEGNAHFSDVPSIIFCAAYAEVPELLQHMKRNYQFWKEQEIMGVTGLPPEHIIPLTPTELVRKIEFEALAECKETVEPAEDK
jgi:hypothetical protein